MAIMGRLMPTMSPLNVLNSLQLIKMNDYIYIVACTQHCGALYRKFMSGVTTPTERVIYARVTPPLTLILSPVIY